MNECWVFWFDIRNGRYELECEVSTNEPKFGGIFFFCFLFRLGCLSGSCVCVVMTKMGDTFRTGQCKRKIVHDYFGLMTTLILILWIIIIWSEQIIKECIPSLLRLRLRLQLWLWLSCWCTYWCGRTSCIIGSRWHHNGCANYCCRQWIYPVGMIGKIKPIGIGMVNVKALHCTHDGRVYSTRNMYE